MGLLDGRAVVITGAGRGLGRSFAIAVAREGAAVVVNDIDVEEAEKVVAEIASEGGSAVASGASVAAWDSAGDVIDRCVGEFGAIDGLVNNAVAYSYFGPPWDEEGEQIRKAVEVNLLGTLYCGVHAMRRMREQRGGSIVNVTSRAMIGIPGASTYIATKGAIASATFGWALELAPDNVRVNALAPGAMTRGHELAGGYATYAKSTADSPDRVAPAVVYLLSDLSAGVNGQIVALMSGRLGVMRPPELIPVEERDEWTAEEIAARLRDEYVKPLGLEAAKGS